MAGIDQGTAGLLHRLVTSSALQVPPARMVMATCHHHSRRWHLERTAGHQSVEQPCSTLVNSRHGASFVADVGLSRRKGMAPEHFRCATSLPAGQQKNYSDVRL